MRASERTAMGVAWALRFAIAAATLRVLWEGDIVLAATGVGTLAVALVGPGLGLFARYTVPPFLDVLVAAAAAAHVFGHVLDWYHVVPGYDTVLHYAVSLVPALIAYIALAEWVRRLTGEQDLARVGLGHAVILGVLVLALTLLVGVTWEIAEWATDALLGLNNQQGNADTMRDLVMDGLAGVTMAVAGPRVVTADGAVADARRAVRENVRRLQKET